MTVTRNQLRLGGGGVTRQGRRGELEVAVPLTRSLSADRGGGGVQWQGRAERVHRGACTKHTSALPRAPSLPPSFDFSPSSLALASQSQVLAKLGQEDWQGSEPLAGREKLEGSPRREEGTGREGGRDRVWWERDGKRGGRQHEDRAGGRRVGEGCSLEGDSILSQSRGWVE